MLQYIITLHIYLWRLNEGFLYIIYIKKFRNVGYFNLRMRKEMHRTQGSYSQHLALSSTHIYIYFKIYKGQESKRDRLRYIAGSNK